MCLMNSALLRREGTAEGVTDPYAMVVLAGEPDAFDRRCSSVLVGFLSQAPSLLVALVSSTCCLLNNAAWFVVCSTALCV